MAKFIKDQSLLLLEKLNELDMDTPADMCERLHEDAETLWQVMRDKLGKNNSTGHAGAGVIFAERPPPAGGFVLRQFRHRHVKIAAVIFPHQLRFQLLVHRAFPCRSLTTSIIALICSGEHFPASTTCTPFSMANRSTFR